MKGYLDTTVVSIQRYRFTVRDPSDEPHVVTALISGCNAILTYDSHFADGQAIISVLTLDELLTSLSQED
jgi:predicted nucleic acid-binding protein